MEKRLLQFILFIVCLIFIGRTWNPLWRMDLDEAINPSSSAKIVFHIEKGSSAKEVASNLEDADLIKNKSSFIKDIKDLNLEGAIRYGSFVLSPSMTLEEIVEILTTEGSGELALTIPEGWTIDQIDARLTELGLIKAGEFSSCAADCEFNYKFLEKNANLEGYLFPDTYFIDNANFEVEGLIDQILGNFDNRWTEEMQSQLEASDRTLDQIVIVASMLEKEVRTEEDLAMVSGIIWNRLDNDWTLGIDATLLYKDEDGKITVEDLSEDSPYNTRLNTGLPPTAIGNPGLATLKAALNPTFSEYWFYLTDSAGKVYYATTNAEHEENKAKYLE